ncbi:MAG TPA: MgtC/SapB family protein [Clostridia bacterium]
MSLFVQQMIFLAQVAGSMLLGSIIGLERRLREKEAGIRTHALVAGASCLLMIISIHGFEGEFDAARVAAQIVTGIGFLGAGMILYKRHVIHGLTTAAGVWFTAAIGMCVGAGLYYLAAGGTLALFLFQYIMHLNRNPLKSKDFITYKIKFIISNNEQELVKSLFGAKSFVNYSLEYQDDKLICTGYIRSLKVKNESDLKDIISRNNFILSLEKIAD